MTYSKCIKVAFEAVKGIDHTGVGKIYAPLGSPTSNPACSIIISSSYNTAVFLSVDGITDHIFVPSYMVEQIDFGSNKEGIGKYLLPKDTQFFLKQGPDGAPFFGDLYISFLIGR